jgi:hypothetical protein
MNETRIHDYQEKKDYLAIVTSDLKECLISAGLYDTLALALLGTMAEEMHSWPDVITALMALGSGLYGFSAGMMAVFLIDEINNIQNNYTTLYDYSDLIDYRKEKTLQLKKLRLYK